MSFNIKTRNFSPALPLSVVFALAGWFVTIAIGAVGLVWFSIAIVLALFGKRQKPKPLAVCFVTIAFAYFTYWAVGGWFFPPMDDYWDSLARVLPVLFVACLPLALPTYINTERLWFWFYATTISALLILCLIIGWGDIVMNKSRPNGFHGNPLLAGSALFTASTVMLCGWSRYSLGLKTLVTFIYGFCMISSFIWVEARAASLMMICFGMPMLAVLWLSDINGAKRWLWRSVATLVLLILITLGVVFIVEIWQYQPAIRMRNGVLELSQGVLGFFHPGNAGDATVIDRSVSIRALMWEHGIAAFQQSPIVGNGVHHRFDAVDVSLFKRFRPKFSHLHSSILNHLVGGGIIGLGLYLALVCYPALAYFTGKIRKTQSYLSWHKSDQKQRQELVLLALVAMFVPIAAGLSNVVMFETTLATLAMVPLAFWTILVIAHCDNNPS